MNIHEQDLFPAIPLHPSGPIKDIRIVRSRNRRRTISASMKDGVLVVRAPERISQAELDKVVSKFKRLFERRALKKELDSTRELPRMAEQINKEYFGGRLNYAGIEYAPAQEAKFGCCNLRTTKIRIAATVAKMPRWVRYYVVFHELAHLVEPNHDKRFYELVGRYRLAERARGFLIARGLEKDEDDSPVA